MSEEDLKRKLGKLQETFREPEKRLAGIEELFWEHAGSRWMDLRIPEELREDVPELRMDSCELERVEDSREDRRWIRGGLYPDEGSANALADPEAWDLRQKEPEGQNAPRWRLMAFTDGQGNYREPGDFPIDDLDLSIRSYNSLKRKQVNTVADLIRLGSRALWDVRNLGKKGVDEIVRKLAEIGVTLSEEGQEV